MELDELHVRNPSPCSSGQSHAITSGNIWVTGIEINLASPASTEHDNSGSYCEDILVWIHHIGTMATRSFPDLAFFCARCTHHQIHTHVVF